jgi:predicted ATPase/class 3 adenylate cyclase
MRELPAGTVTFLFTDVEGSTKLLHELGAAAYAEALGEHRRVLREAFGAQGGVEVDTQGDAFFVAFPTAPGALEAAADAREGLASGPIRVRMGIHTGTPHVAGEGYVGVDVHRAARIAACGHGGQVLVSAATAALVDNSGLRDLGDHRLKDLSTPERIYQLGNGDFPPLKSLHRTNLPIPATPFLGRDEELAAVTTAIGESRLVTLTGPGGTGKTRLAIQAAAEVADASPDGVWWVSLTPVRDASLVRSAIAQALQGKGELEEQIGDNRLLLVLDNFEQVIDAATDLAALHGACPNLRMVVTSRERLQLAGEREYPVPTLSDEDGVELFAARAHSLQVDLSANGAVRELCERLDNLPLALELAAARTKLYTPEQLLERLGERLDLFKGGRDADPRQQTLRATIEWSYELLTPDEQRLFAQLSVFVGGCTIDAAEAVCDADTETLQSLLDKSLLRRRQGSDGHSRLWMLETIREFAAERHRSTAEYEQVRRRHAEWYAQLGERLQEPMRDGDPEATARLIDELGNFRAVLEWSAASASPRPGFSIVWALWYYWITRGLRAESLRWAQWTVAEADKLSPKERAFGLLGASELLRMFGDTELAERLKRDLIALFKSLGMENRVAATLADLAEMAAARGDFAEARRLAEEALALRRRLGADYGIAHALCNYGLVEFRAGQYDHARLLFEEALCFAEQAGDTPTTEMMSALLSGECARRCGDIEAARAHLRRTLPLARELGQRVAFPELLQEVAAVAEPESVAAQLLAAADRLWREIDVPRWDPEDFARTVELVRDDLGPDFARAWEGGAGLTEEEALALAGGCLE